MYFVNWIMDIFDALNQRHASRRRQWLARFSCLLRSVSWFGHSGSPYSWSVLLVTVNYGKPIFKPSWLSLFVSGIGNNIALRSLDGCDSHGRDFDTIAYKENWTRRRETEGGKESNTALISCIEDT